MILAIVNFYFDESRIKEESFPLLNEVTDTLKEHKELTKIRVEGHTDLRGKAKHNKELSKGRAKAVFDYLVEHGVEKSRLSSEGYGMDKPVIKKAKNEEEHLKNRRVEFTILERKE